MNKNRIIVGILLMSSLVANGQVGSLDFSSTGGSAEAANMGLNDVMRKIRTTDNEKLVKVLGSPYLMEEWQSVKMLTVLGGVIKDVKLKYNIYFDELVGMKNGSTDSVMIKKDLIGAFQFVDFTDSVLVFKKFKVSSNVRKSEEATFYQVLHEGKINLIKFHSKKIRNFDTETSSIVDTNLPRLVSDNELFLLKEDGTNVSLSKKGKRKILAFFGYQSSSLNSFIKEKNLNLKSESDVILILDAYDKLNK